MASKGKIDEIIDLKAVKSQVDYLKSEIDSIISKFSEYAKAINEVNKQIKNATGMNDLNEQLKKNTKLVDAAVQNSNAYVNITNQLTKAEAAYSAASNGGFENLKKTIAAKKNLAEVTKQAAKELADEANAGKVQVASIQEQIAAAKRQVETIKAIGEENKKLIAIKGQLHLDNAQEKDLIDQINTRLDENTTILKANGDAATRQRMNIGNYKSAVQDLQVVLEQISTDLQRMADSGQEGSAEFKELQDKADKTRSQIDVLSKSIVNLGEKETTLKGQVRAMREELSQMVIAGKKGSAEYVELSNKASALQDVLSDVNDEIKNGARDNLFFKGITNGLSGLAGGLEAGMGAWGMAIGKSEEFEVVMQKVASAIAIANGLEQLSAMIAEESAAKKLAVRAADLVGYNSVIGAQTLSITLSNAEAVAGQKLSAGKKVLIALQWAWNKALMANPLVVFIALIGAALAGVYFLGKALGFWGASNAAAEAKLTDLTKQVELQTKANARYIEILKARGAAEAQIVNESISLAADELKAKEDLFIRTAGLYGEGRDAYKDALAAQTEATDNFQKKLLDGLVSIESIIAAEKRAQKVDAFGELSTKVDDANVALAEQLQTLLLLEKYGIIAGDALAGMQQKLIDANQRSVKKASDEQKQKDADAAKKKLDAAEANAKKQLDLLRRIKDSELSLVTDANQKELAELELKFTREIEDIKGNGKLEKALRVQLEREKKEAIKTLGEKQEAEAKSNTLKLEQEKLQLQLEALDEGSAAYLSKKLEIINKERELELSEAVTTKQDVGAINAKYNKKLLDESLNQIIQYNDKVSQQRLAATDKEQLEKEKQLLDQYNLDVKNGGDLKALTEKYEKDKLAIEEKYGMERLAYAITLARQLVDAMPDGSQAKIDAMAKLAAAEKAYLDAGVAMTLDANGKKIASDEEVKAKKEAIIQASFDLAQEINSSIKDLADNAFEGQLQQIEIAAQKDAEAKQAELDRAGNNETLKTAINAKYDAREKVREKEKQAIALKQAKFEKMSALFGIALSTAMAVSKSIAESPLTFGLPFSAFALAAGLLQAAVVISKPLPKYFKGRDGGPAEWAIVGDQGQEAIQYPGGKTTLTPDHATMAYLPAGAKVIPNKDLIAMSEAVSFTKVPEYTAGISATDIRKLRDEIAGLYGGFEMLAHVVKNKTEHHVNITERGIWASSQRGASRAEYINNNIRF